MFNLKEDFLFPLSLSIKSSIFIFLIFLFISASSAFSATHTFYKDLTGTGQCSFSSSSFCANAFNNVVKRYNYRYKQEGCDFFGYQDINVRYSETPPSYNATGLYYDDAAKSIVHVTSAQKMTHVCQSGEKFELIGCTPKCVPDECEAGKVEQRISQCGMLTGTNCTSKATPDPGDTFTKTCASYTFNWLPLGSKYNVAGCEANVTKQVPLVKNNGNLEPNAVYDGSSDTIPLNCEIELTLSGQKYQDDPSSPPTTN